MQIIVFSLLVLSIIMPFNAFALSDQEYKILKENSQEFSDADNSLGQVWKKVGSSLSELDARDLIDDQRQWIKHGWDESANRLMKSQNLSRTKAYSQAINERIEYLNNYSSKTDRFVSVSHTSQPVSSDIITVEAEGMGATKTDALKAAWKEAVQKGVGLFMTSNTKAINDDILENIVEHSRGKINSYKILNENLKDGVYYLTLSANIEKDILKEPTKFSKSKKISFDGKNLAASQDSKENNMITAESLLEEIPKIINLPSLIKYDAELGEVKYKEEKYYVLNSTVKIDLENFLIQAKELHKYLSQIAIKKYPVAFVENSARRGIKILKQDKYKFEIFGNQSIIDIKLNRKPSTKSDIGQPSGFYWNGVREKTSICVYENIRGAICYKLEPQLYKKLAEKLIKNKKYKIEFIGEVGEGENSFSTEAYVEYPYSSDWIVPAFGFMNGQACVLQTQVVLDMDKEELLNTTEIEGKYELKPY